MDNTDAIAAAISQVFKEPDLERTLTVKAKAAGYKAYGMNKMAGDIESLDKELTSEFLHNKC